MFFLKSSSQYHFSKLCLLVACLSAFSFNGIWLNQYHFLLGQAPFYFAVLSLATSGYRPNRIPLVWCVAFIGYCLISALGICYLGDGLCTRRPYTGVVSIVFIFLIVQYAAHTVSNSLKFEKKIEQYLVASAWIVVLLSFPYVVDLFIGAENRTQHWQHWVHNLASKLNVGSRLKELTLEPSYLGMVIAMLYPIALIRANEESAIKKSLLRWFLVLGLWIPLFLSSSRVGVFVCLGLTALILVMWPKRFLMAAVFGGAMFYIMLPQIYILIANYGPTLLGWFSGGGLDGSTLVRISHMQASINLWSEFPLWGVGLGQSGYLLHNYYPETYGPNSPEFAHWTNQAAVGGVPSFSFIPRAVSEIGIIGVLILMVGVLSALKNLPIQFKKSRSVQKYTFAFIGFLVASFGVDGYLYIPAWIIFGALIGILNRKTQLNI